MEGSDYYDPDVVARDLRELDRKPVIMTAQSPLLEDNSNKKRRLNDYDSSGEADERVSGEYGEHGEQHHAALQRAKAEAATQHDHQISVALAHAAAHHRRALGKVQVARQRGSSKRMFHKADVVQWRLEESEGKRIQQARVHQAGAAALAAQHQQEAAHANALHQQEVERANTQHQQELARLNQRHQEEAERANAQHQQDLARLQGQIARQAPPADPMEEDNAEAEDLTAKVKDLTEVLDLRERMCAEYEEEARIQKERADDLEMVDAPSVPADDALKAEIDRLNDLVSSWQDSHQFEAQKAAEDMRSLKHSHNQAMRNVEQANKKQVDHMESGLAHLRFQLQGGTQQQQQAARAQEEVAQQHRELQAECDQLRKAYEAKSRQEDEMYEKGLAASRKAKALERENEELTRKLNGDTKQPSVPANGTTSDGVQLPYDPTYVDPDTVYAEDEPDPPFEEDGTPRPDDIDKVLARHRNGDVSLNSETTEYWNREKVLMVRCIMPPQPGGESAAQAEPELIYAHADNEDTPASRRVLPWTDPKPYYDLDPLYIDGPKYVPPETEYMRLRIRRMTLAQMPLLQVQAAKRCLTRELQEQFEKKLFDRVVPKNETCAEKDKYPRAWRCATKILLSMPAFKRTCMSVAFSKEDFFGDSCWPPENANDQDFVVRVDVELPEDLRVITIDDWSREPWEKQEKDTKYPIFSDENDEVTPSWEGPNSFSNMLDALPEA